MQIKLTTLKDLCAAQNNPYHEIAYDESHSGGLAKVFDGVTVWDVKAPLIYTGLVEDVHIFGRTFIYAKDDSYVFNCQSYLNHNYQGLEGCIKMSIEANRSELFKTYVEEECIFLGGTWTEPTEQGPGHLVYSPNFGHFIFEYLNRFAIFDLYRLTERLPVVIYDCLPARWSEFLELLGIPAERQIRVPIMNSPAYRKVWVSSACHYRDIYGFTRFWIAGLHWFRFRVLSAIGGPRLQDRRRIYLGRENAKWRKVANEDQVKHLLEQYGFEFPDMSRMSARAQIETMSGAEFVVSTVGAGGIMPYFAPEHCINILMGPKDVGTGPFGGNVGPAVVGQIYERIDCDLVEYDTQVRLNRSGVNELADFRVDLDVLKEKVERGLKMIPDRQHRDALKL